ncbi:hypothetical protein [Streptomyces sp. gCLA4]|uniref:hypothetical protein n=1 Tax=Streptomyces sp. gCLA4 TaxID=1873416 RepID=UPI0015FEFAA0|nr:hypothetical protein [Streptomyces sp. gCLA4]
MKAQTSPAGAEPPPTIKTAVATDGSGPRIILDERAMARIAMDRGLYEKLFPMRRALDPMMLNALLLDGVLTADDIRSAVLIAAEPPIA